MSGRGAYYKAKYGGGGGGRGGGKGGSKGGKGGGAYSDRGSDRVSDRVSERGSSGGRSLRPLDDLRDTLRRIDGKSYPCYKDLLGAWDYGRFVLYVDHVQGDAYASPSKFRVQVCL
jgi:hypothetical protein